MGQLIKYLIVAGLTIWLAVALANGVMRDPFGATTRRQIESRTAIETTRLESQTQTDAARYAAQAAIESANAKAQAQIQSAEAAAEAKKVQAQERRKSHQAWAGMMPILFTILAAGGALWLVIIYRGRAVLILAERGVLDGVGLPTLPTFDVPIAHRLPEFGRWQGQPQPADPDSVLADYAARQNQYVHEQNGIYLLVDKQSNQIVRRLAPRQ